MSARRIARALAAALVTLALLPALAHAASAPTGVTAVALTGKVELAWQPVAGASSYNVYRGTTPTTITTLVSPGGGVLGTSYADTSVSNGTTYYYVVRSVASGFESTNSLTVQASPAARSCNTGNPVVLENCMPGANTWLAKNVATVAGGGIEGYATAQSVNHGGSIDLKINTAAGAPYNIEIYRMGDYGGQGGRLFSVMRGLTGTAQPACANDNSTGLYDCSNWSVSTTLSTTASWPSGMYLLRLVRTDNSLNNNILLAVRADERAPDVVFGSGFSTFQAYNPYGGRSFYEFNSGGGNTVAGTPRAVKLSFDRPYDQSRITTHDWFTVTEQPFVQWLEHEGYDMGYISGTDLETNPALARQGHAYISPSHDEYISSNMRAAMLAARDAGVGVFFGGANAVFWRVRYENGGHVLVCYKTSQSGAADPVSPTTTWRDVTGANNPENALLGQQFVGQNTGQSFPLKVTADQASDRLWRYTGLDKMAPGATATIGHTIVGWEWDSRVSNGAEPAGVKTLGGSPVTGDILQDAGKVFSPGSATANITKYKAASGAVVVATGTNQWWRGLGMNQYNEGDPAPEVQQFTTNALADMGALPATPPATITLDTPPNSVPVPTGVAATAVGTDSITISWNAVAGATGYSVYRLRTARDGGYPLGARANGANVTGTTFTDTGLNSGTPYYYVVTATVGGAQSAPSSEASATTPATAIAPIRINTGGTAYTAVSGAAFTADGHFSGGQTSSITQSISGTNDPALYQDERWGDFSYSIPVTNGTYDVRFHFVEDYFGTAVAGGAGKRVFGMNIGDTAASPDLANIDIYAAVGPRAPLVRTVSNVVVSDGVLNINTVRGAADDPEVAAIEVIPAAPPGPPAVTQKTPADGTTGVVTTVKPSATFSRDMDASTLTSTNFKLQRVSDNSAVTATVAYAAATQTATLTPSAPLAFNTQYRATLTTAVKAADGTALANAVTWTFTTGDPPPPPTITAVTPTNGSTGVAIAAKPTATFSRAMNASTLTTSSFTLTPSGGSAVAASVSYDSATNVATLTPTSALAYSTTYTAAVTTAAKAADGIALASQVTWTFTTADPPPPDLTAPTVAITSPADNATLQGTNTLTATASDNVGVVGVQYQLDGANLGAEDTAAPYNLTWNSFGVSNGAHVLTAIARDAADNRTTSATIHITLNNPAVDPTGLVGAWGFEEAGGTTATDTSLAHNDGTLSNVTRGTGKYGAGLTFNGTSSWVTVPASSSLDLGGAMTLEAWVNPTGLTANDFNTVMLRERTSNAMSYSLYANNDNNRPSGHVSTGGTEVNTAGTAQIPLNAWTHLATTYDGSTLRLYVNGTLVSSKAVTGTIDASSLPLRIGGNNVWHEYFKGTLDELRVYKRALSASEIGIDMNSAVKPATPDTSPPTVSITAPANGATVSGTATVNATAADDRAVAGVQLKVDGANVGSPDTSSPYSFSWDTRAVSNGVHHLTAVATDTGGNSTTSATVDVTVDNGSPPTVSITAPAAGATLTGNATLSANAGDDRGVTSVQFRVDGSNAGAADTSSPYSISWDSTTVSNGSHSITAVATDTDGNTTTSSAVSVTTSNAVTTPSGLIAAYGFEEASGTTALDSSISGLNGTINGAARTATGKIGKALTFNGGGNIVTVPDAPVLHLTTGMTLEAWVNPTTVTGWRSVLLKEQAGALSYALYANTDTNRPSGHVNPGSESDTRGTAILAANTWTHLAATYDGTTLRLFVNGTQVSSKAVSGPIQTSGGTLDFGGNNVWGEWFAGSLDEIRLYNRALSVAEIQGDMTRAVP